jgi:hypothetical protein
MKMYGKRERMGMEKLRGEEKERRNGEYREGNEFWKRTMSSLLVISVDKSSSHGKGKLFCFLVRNNNNFKA